MKATMPRWTRKGRGQPVENRINRWSVLIAACLINLCLGSIYAWSVFAAPMAAHLGLNTGDLAIVFVIANGVGPITMIFGGGITEKIGASKVILIGGLMFGLGILLSGFAGSLGGLILWYSLVGGLGLGMTYGCTITNTLRFFPDKRGLVGGVLTAVYGLSSVLVPPVANSLIGSHGVLAAFRIVGAAFLVIIGGASLLIRQAPPDYRPDGWTPSAVQASALKANKDWRRMLRDPVFYTMIGLLMCGAFYGLMIISQASPIAQNLVGVAPGTAAFCVSVLALFNMAGRIVAGYISDHFGRVNTLTVMLLLSVVGFILMLNSGHDRLWLFMAALAIIGVSFGSFMGIFPGFTADQFGTRHNGVNYGIMFIGFALSGLLSPMILNYLYGSRGNYQTAFLACIGLAILGLALTCLYRRQTRAMH